jgi:putative flippase GtrA
VGFIVNKTWTFKTDTKFLQGYIKFLTIAFYSFLFVLFITFGLVHYLAFHYVWARTVSAVLIGFIGYFLDMKITFRV